MTYTVIRHVASIIFGALVPYVLIAQDVIGTYDPELATRVLSAAETMVSVAVFAVVWLISEKGLKIPFYKALGERQPGDVVDGPTVQNSTVL
jgi:hypothetical protein